MVNHGGTIHEFVQAHSKLVGSLLITSVVNQHGVELPSSHCLGPGQVICIRCEDSPASATELAEMRQDCDMPDASNEGSVAVGISPTIAWSQPVIDPSAHSTGPFVGEAPAGISFGASVITAAPLLSLQSDQLMRLRVPVVLHDAHVESLCSQPLRTCDRLKILEHQASVWSDDEFRYHLQCLSASFADFQLRKGVSGPIQCFVLDPLLTTGWLHHGLHEIHAWGSAHSNVKSNALTVITACMNDGHWIPLVMKPQGQNLHVQTWDSQHHDHSLLNRMSRPFLLLWVLTMWWLNGIIAYSSILTSVELWPLHFCHIP